MAKGSSYQPESNAEAADADSCTVEASGDYDLNAEGTYEIVFNRKRRQRKSIREEKHDINRGKQG